jgi:hypothetical protein
MPANEDDATVVLSPAGATTELKWWRPIVETAGAVSVIAVILYALDTWNKNFETNAILIAILPVLFWLFASGRLASFKAFGVEMKSAIRQVSSETIQADQALITSSTIEFAPVDPDVKGKIAKIAAYIQRKVPAISFELGRQGYYEAAAIQRYLDDLCAYNFFKWVVFKHRDGRFAGLISAHKLRAFGRSAEAQQTGYQSIVRKIEAQTVGDLPGFIGPESELSATSTKGQAIEKLSKTDLDDLPVVDGQRKFVGVLNRGQVQSSILASILRAAHSPS